MLNETWISHSPTNVVKLKRTNSSNRNSSLCQECLLFLTVSFSTTICKLYPKKCHTYSITSKQGDNSYRATILINSYNCNIPQEQQVHDILPGEEESSKTLGSIPSSKFLQNQRLIHPKSRPTAKQYH